MNVHLSFCGEANLMQQLEDAFIQHGLHIDWHDSHIVSKECVIRASQPSRKSITTWTAIGKAADAAKAFIDLLTEKKLPSIKLTCNFTKTVIHISKSDSPEKLERIFEEQKDLKFDFLIE